MRRNSCVFVSSVGESGCWERGKAENNDERVPSRELEEEGKVTIDSIHNTLKINNIENSNEEYQFWRESEFEYRIVKKNGLKFEIICNKNEIVDWNKTFEVPTQRLLFEYSEFLEYKFNIPHIDKRVLHNEIEDLMKAFYLDSPPWGHPLPSTSRSPALIKEAEEVGEGEGEGEDYKQEGKVNRSRNSRISRISTSPYRLPIERNHCEYWTIDWFLMWLKFVHDSGNQSLYSVLKKRFEEQQQKRKEEYGARYSLKTYATPLLQVLKPESPSIDIGLVAQRYFGSEFGFFLRNLDVLLRDEYFDLTKHIVMQKCMKNQNVDSLSPEFMERSKSFYDFEHCKRFIMGNLRKYFGSVLDEKKKSMYFLPVKLILCHQPDDGRVIYDLWNFLECKVLSKASSTLGVSDLPLGITHAGLLIANIFVHYTSLGLVKIGVVNGRGHPLQTIFAADLGIYKLSGKQPIQPMDDMIDSVSEMISRALLCFNRDSRYLQSKTFRLARKRKLFSGSIHGLATGQEMGVFYSNCQEFIQYFTKSILRLEFLFPQVVQQYIDEELRSSGRTMKFRFSTMKRFSEFGQIFELDKWMDCVDFETHEKLDQFIIYLFSKRMDFPVLFPGVYELLKGFDRAFWQRKIELNKDDQKKGKYIPFRCGCPLVVGNWRSYDASSAGKMCMERIIKRFRKINWKPRWMKQRRSHKNKVV